MRLRATALLVAIAMIVPTAAAAGSVGCDAEMVLQAQCCCDGEPAAETGDPVPSLERVCCCDLERAPANAVASDADTALAPTRLDPLAPPAAVSVAWRVDPPRATVALPPPRARGPPPARTLLAQHTSLLC